MNRPSNKMIAVFCFAMLVPGSLLKADDMADNPRYAVWSKFKEGSSSTLSVDLDINNNRVHLDVTKTLISVNADQAVVETVTKATVMGHDQAKPGIRETILAKAPKSDIKETGNREIIAMGKTFHCKVWDATGENPNDATHSGMGDAAGGMKAVIYVNSDVPGGVVELDGVGQNGKPMNFVLTAMDVK